MHPSKLLLLDRSNLSKFLGEGELLFLHHLVDALLAYSSNLSQKICAEYPHVLVHGHAYLLAQEQNHLGWSQSRC